MKTKYKVSGEIFEWRGPAPFHFVAMSAIDSKEIKVRSREFTYGWGVIPVTCKLGKTEFTTALIPRESLYFIPIKDLIRKNEKIEIGDKVTITIELGRK